MNTNDMNVNWDRDHIIHPVYPVGEKIGPVIENGHGVILLDTEGNEYIDCRAQLACVNLGYGRREIIDAVMEQMDKLQYTTLFIFYVH